MQMHQADFKVSRMASVLNVSLSGFYHWLRYGELPSQRVLQQRYRDEQIQQIFADSK